MADKLVTIATFPDYIEADLARQLLADFGIKSFVREDEYWLPDQAKLQVFESQAKQAQEILESQESQKKQEQ